jgi:O-antigen ligase/tetratricopeptide (TPR) repeat protein
MPPPAAADALPPRHAAAGRFVLFVHLALSPVVFCTVTPDAFEGPKFFLLIAAAVALAGLAASAWLQRPGGLRPGARPDLLTLGALLFTASAVVSTACSVSPLTSWRGAPESRAGLQTVLGCLTLYLGTRFFCRTAADGRRLLFAAVLGAGLSATYALVQAAGRDPMAWGGTAAFADKARPFAFFGHANFLGGYLSLAGPLVAALVVRAAADRRWTACAALALVGGAAAVATAFTLSRAAWLALGGAAGVLVVGWWAAGARRSAVGPAAALGLGLAAVAAWLCLAPGHGGWADALAERLRRFDDGEGRLPIWRAAWDLFRSRPLTGWGVDAFQLAFGAKRPPEYGLVEWDATPTKAHNEVLHLLATQGLLGLAGAAVLAAGVVRAGVGAWRRAEAADRPLVVGVFAALVAFAVQGLFGFTVLGVGTLAVTCAALLATWGRAGRVNAPVGVVIRDRRQYRGVHTPRSPGVPAWRRLAQAGVALTAAVILAAAVVRPLRAAVAAGDGDRVVSADPAGALACYDRAVELDPADARAWLKLAGAAQAAARQAPPAERQQLYGRAVAALDRAAALTPADPYVSANRGRLLGEMAAAGLARPADASAAWDAALAADPANASFLAEAARTALAVGDYGRARRLADRGEALYPGCAYWPARRGAAAFAEGRLDEAADDLEAAARADWRGDDDGVVHAFATLAAIRLAQGKPEWAATLAEQVCAHAPAWPTPWRLRGRACEALGRRDAAREAFSCVLRLVPGDAEGRDALRRLEAVPPKP